MRTLFFDIDGTLLITHQAGSGAMQRTIESEFGLCDVSMDVSFGGSTDCFLVAELLRINGLADSGEMRGRFRRRYSEYLRDEIAERGGVVLPGVHALIGQLTVNAQIRLAVMTGNFPETGLIKLQKFQLDRYFPWVAGGDLDPHRDDLARRVIGQLQRMHGAQSAEDVIVIGDTPKDIQCAHAVGAKCLAVCTGGFDRSELTAAAADFVVDDLTDPAAYDFLTS